MRICWNIHIRMCAPLRKPVACVRGLVDTDGGRRDDHRDAHLRPPHEPDGNQQVEHFSTLRACCMVLVATSPFRLPAPPRLRSWSSEGRRWMTGSRTNGGKIACGRAAFADFGSLITLIERTQHWMSWSCMPSAPVSTRPLAPGLSEWAHVVDVRSVCSSLADGLFASAYTYTYPYYRSDHLVSRLLLQLESRNLRCREDKANPEPQRTDWLFLVL